jgi:hypothetical protein
VLGGILIVDSVVDSWVLKGWFSVFSPLGDSRPAEQQGATVAALSRLCSVGQQCAAVRLLALIVAEGEEPGFCR